MDMLINTADEICTKYGFVLKEIPIANWPDQNQKFMLADEVAEIGNQLIRRFRPDLGFYKIGYVFQQKASKTSSGVTLGKASTQNDLQKILHGYDALIIVGFDQWLDAEPDQKFRLTYHELEHLVIDEEKGKITIAEHPVEEFPSVVRVFGPGKDADVEFIAAYEEFRRNNVSLIQ